MKYALIVSIGIFCLGVLTACSSHTAGHNNQVTAVQGASYPLSTRSFSNSLINELTHQLYTISSRDKIAVTSLSWLSGDLNSSNVIALQLQEEFMAELTHKKLHVIEFKLSDGIRVAPDGDFALTRNYLELEELQQIDYILTGTLLENSQGLVVNLRLVDFHTKTIISTAQTLIPLTVLDTIKRDNGIAIYADSY